MRWDVLFYFNWYIPHVEQMTEQKAETRVEMISAYHKTPFHIRHNSTNLKNVQGKS